MLTVDRLGKNLRDGRLAGSARSREQIGVADTIGTKLILQRSHNVVLALHIIEGVRPKFSI